MQSIGERLEEARKRKGLSIREAAEATKIRSDYLHKFEGNQFDINLPEIYVRGFLRTYANFLKAPADKIINDYNGLGLGENKGVRGLNREVYGRMDLTVGSKMEKDSKENTGPAAGGTEQVATNEDATPRNPATFVPPRQIGRAPLDRDLILKLSLIVGVVAIVALLIVLVFTGRSKSPTTTASSSTDAIWVKPLAGEAILPLVANAPVSVTVSTKAENTILYQGTIPRGDRRDIPRRGALKIVSDPFQNLTVEIGGKLWPMKDRVSEVNAP